MYVKLLELKSSVEDKVNITINNNYKRFAARSVVKKL